MHKRSWLCVTLALWVGALGAGCSGSVEAERESVGEQAISAPGGSWHHALVTGHQYGALPPQQDVTVTVDFQVQRLGNGGSSVFQEIALPVWINVRDPLARPGDNYRLTLWNTVQRRDSSGNGQTFTDKYVLALSFAESGRFTGQLGAPVENNHVSDDGGLEVFFSDEGIDSPINQSLEIEKMIGANWVPLKEPLSYGDGFQLQLDAQGNLGPLP